MSALVTPRYAPDGLSYDSLPRDPGLTSSAGALLGLLSNCLKDGKARWLPDLVLAEKIGRSVSTVQRALAYLESAKHIERRWDDALKCRTIRRTFSLKESRNRTPKSKDANGKGPKKFGPPLLKFEQGDCSNLISAPSLLEGEQEKETRAGADDVRLECRSPSPASGIGDAGGEEPKSADELKALKDAELERLRALRAAMDGSARAPVPAPVESEPNPWRLKPRWELLHALPEAEQDQLAAGDRIIRHELEQARAARRAAEDQTSAPPLCADPVTTVESPPRGRDSPEIVAPPPAKPRRGVLGRLFGRG